ncbi:MAG: hypothetical protein JXA14_26155 [Anaerolineae bacterium]|nr:hypothetical protein [Anaerolineae bacterium]
MMIDEYLLDEYLPAGGDNQPQAVAIRPAADAAAAAVIHAIKAGLKSGRYVVVDGTIILAKERG